MIKNIARIIIGVMNFYELTEEDRMVLLLALATDSTISDKLHNALKNHCNTSTTNALSDIITRIKYEMKEVEE